MDAKPFLTARIIAFAMFVGSPIAYLIIAFVIERPLVAGGEYDMLFRIILIVAMVQPLLAFVVERSQVRAFRARRQKEMTASQLLVTLAINKAAFVSVVFIYGLVVYLLSGDLLRMLWFYPIGAIWSVIHWPRREKWNMLIQTLETP
jgi:hypothetical protein